MNITFLVAPYCFSSGISGLADAFTIADLWHADLTGSRDRLFSTEIVSIDGGPVVGSGGIRLVADRALADASATDCIVVPPFIPLPRFDTPEMARIKEWLITRRRAGTPIAALCTGVFLLAETGLLDGRLATTHWQFARKFKRRYPRVNLQPEQVMTEDDGLLCTGAATAYFNLGLALIEKYGSKELADVCARSLLIDRNRTSQAPYAVELGAERHADTGIAKAQRYMENNYARIASVDEVAEHVCLSSRHFKRRFKKATGSSPLAYLQTLRIEMAKKRLASTLDSVDEITLQIGYENASTFRRLFKQRTSLSPREYRDKFARRSRTEPVVIAGGQGEEAFAGARKRDAANLSPLL